uniref:SMC5-SMC6 complex localization factor 1 n=1 Tax=Latimeria chalumnae TaxID=7897 RepID=H3B6Q0_LATCH
ISRGTPSFTWDKPGVLLEISSTVLLCLFYLECVTFHSRWKEYRGCTHLIAKKPCQSEKFLAVCAAGKWILTKEYVIVSAKAGRWVDEAAYEWGSYLSKGSVYPVAMETAAKRWREKLECSRAPGAFHDWKVVLFLRKDDKRRGAFERILRAGKATILSRETPSNEVTHVLTNNMVVLTEEEKKAFNAPYYPVKYLGKFLLEEALDKTGDLMGTCAWRIHVSENTESVVQKQIEMGMSLRCTQETLPDSIKGLEQEEFEIVLKKHLCSSQVSLSFNNIFLYSFKINFNKYLFQIHSKVNKKSDSEKKWDGRDAISKGRMKKQILACFHSKVTSTFKAWHLLFRNLFCLDGACQSANYLYIMSLVLNHAIIKLCNVLRKAIYFAVCVKYCCFLLTLIVYLLLQFTPLELPRATFNRIENLLDGQFFMEALQELRSQLDNFIPPVCLLQSVLQTIMQDDADIVLSSTFLQVLYMLLHLYPPWQSPSRVKYYLDILQCPVCKRGSWSFIDMVIRSCIYNGSSCHLVSGPDVSELELKPFYKAMLKYFFNLFEAELDALNRSICETTNSQHVNVTPASILGKIFWAESETSMQFTKPIHILVHWVIQASRVNQSNEVSEVAFLLSGMLGVAVEYWLLLSRIKDRYVVNQVENDIASSIFILCDDFSAEELEKLLSLIQSPWLQMFVAEAILKQLLSQNNIVASPEPLSLHKMVSSYLTAFGKLGTCKAGRVQNLQGKKMGQWPQSEPRRPLFTLTGSRQSHARVLPDLPDPNLSTDLPLSKRLRRTSVPEQSTSAKQNCAVSEQKRHLNKCNLKGETALHRACINNKVEKLIELLSFSGIDINVKDNSGWTPLHEACNHGSTECVREILQRCPKVDLLSQVDGVTPLHDALSNGHVEIGKLLLQYGGPVLLPQRDCDGKLPLDYVVSQQLKEELFAILQLEETIEDFNDSVHKEFCNQQIDFGSYLLCRLLLNYCSIYDLSLDFIPLNSKTICFNVTQITGVDRSKNMTNSFSDGLVVQYAKDLETLIKLPDILQQLPENLRKCPGQHVQVLLALLETMLCLTVFSFA